ncbi:DASH family cryptochrome [Photobacterium sp. 1_MG-2023]|uniref:DASH family cryptochrome n=1 Tax=Photobacterium sp. 1_MG-2023 TaxID=3062646 RepID=UPI0026E2C6E2|nr:DASH family cryptochrome [Photobacterium sp. 1_MG-2023]MDO6706927.1 DASH family cryptochrome [Photobacterium sp. 1_MG-2023]
MTTGLFVFSYDLRLHDNPALQQTAAQVDHLLCLYCLPRQTQDSFPNQISQWSAHRRNFLLASLADLNHQLAEQHPHQYLLIRDTPLEDAIDDLLDQYPITVIGRSEQAGYYENQCWAYLASQYPEVAFEKAATHTLFTREQLPFPLQELPASFTQFRLKVETLAYRNEIAAESNLPPPPALPETSPIHPINLASTKPVFSTSPSTEVAGFTGGETAALRHLEQYFSSELPAHYKETRNALDGWENSTKFSPWLALGCLSPVTVLNRLATYHQQVIRNESTEWIQFELLWREYFQWYAHAYQEKLFYYHGIKQKGPDNRHQESRFQQWCQGKTGYPIVDACMRQLNQTGYLSNRGRQLVASCFVHELALDWRYGAAYFEQQLIDYDVASNWGNWQYLAGVGADPRGWRYFDLQKQTDMYDPHREFIQRWLKDD